MRTPLLAANWKMYKTVDEAVEVASALVEALGGRAPTGREVLICAPATALSAGASALELSLIHISEPTRPY